MIRALSPLMCLLVLLAAPLAAAQVPSPIGVQPAPPAAAPAPTTPAAPSTATPSTTAPSTTAPSTNPPSTPAVATPATHVTPTAPAPAITPEQARQAIDVLNDPAKRAAITATLEAIARAQPAAGTPAAAPATASPTAAPGTAGTTAAIPGEAAPADQTSPAAAKTAPLGIPLAPDSLGAVVLVGGSNFMTRMADQVRGTLHAAQGAPLLWLWVVTMATDPIAHMLLIDLSWRLAAALAGAFAVLCLVRYALRRPLRAVTHRLIRLPTTVARRTGRPDSASAASEGGASESGASASGATSSGASNNGDSVAGGSLPGGSEPDDDRDDATHKPENGEARAERGEIEPPARRRFAVTRRFATTHRFATTRLLRRVPLVLARVALELAPVLGFAIAGHLIAGSALGSTRLVRLVLLAVIDSYAVCAAALRLAHALLAPRHRGLRLLPVSDATAIYALRWTGRLVVVGVVGYAAAEVALLLGLTTAAHLALLKAIMLVLHVFVAIIVVQKRRVVRGWIRAPAGAEGLIAGIRNRFAAIWHWIALFYLAALWLVWAVALPAGYGLLSRVLLAFLTVAILARVASRAGVNALERLVRAGSKLSGDYPGLDGRLSFYQPFLRSILHVTVALVALLVFLQMVGLGAIPWLMSSSLGQHIAGSLISLAVTLLLALAAWEAASIAIERHLAHLTRRAQIARIARLRTLLPILRTTLLVAVVTVTVLVVLSEIGVNTAPLLASAGIIGVAIGFGSQKLVQDVITGLFLLLENTMQVGDVVGLGGVSGTVEALSVRTIRLRAEDGSVYVIPFSSVTTVTNMTRDYGRAVILASVAYKAEYDKVVAVLQVIAGEMRADPQLRDVILGDLEVLGLDQLTTSAVVIKCRIMCTPFGRWSVLREFNRRMKARFDELGIAMPSTDQRLIVDQPLTIEMGALASRAPPPVQGPSGPASEAAGPSSRGPSSRGP